MLGILVAYASNAIVRALADGDHAWRWMLGVMVLPAAIFLLLLPTVPETPRWLATAGRWDEAAAVSNRLCATPAESEFQMNEIRESLAAAENAPSVPFFTRGHRKVIMLAIAMWFFFVLVFDLLMLGVLVVTGGQHSGELFPYLLLLNPADVFRVLNVFSLDDVRTLYGLASIVPPTLGNPWLMGGVMLAWVVAPLGIASWRFRL